MSELEDRWFWAYPTESVDCDGITGSAHKVYSKSEVDSVIAKKDKEIQRLEKLCENYRCDNCGAKYIASETEKNKGPFWHRVCNTCYMPMKVKNPFYKEEK